MCCVFSYICENPNIGNDRPQWTVITRVFYYHISGFGFGFFSELVLGLVSNSVAGERSDELVPKCVYVIVNIGVSGSDSRFRAVFRLGVG